jgi:hypothetical protein
MSVGRLRQIGISIALGSCLALGCDGQKSEEPAGAESKEPAAGAAAPVPAADPKAVPDFDAAPTVELPGNFPQDVPRYPGARFVKAYSESEGNWVAQFSSPDDPAKVYANLADAFAAQGWSTERAASGDGIMFYANKGDRSVTCGLLPVKGGTNASLVIVGKP